MAQQFGYLDLAITVQTIFGALFAPRYSSVASASRVHTSATDFELVGTTPVDHDLF